MNMKMFGATIPNQVEIDARKEFESFGVNKEKIQAIKEFLIYLFENERYASNVRYLDESVAIAYWT